MLTTKKHGHAFSSVFLVMAPVPVQVLTVLSLSLYHSLSLSLSHSLSATSPLPVDVEHHVGSYGSSTPRSFPKFEHPSHKLLKESCFTQQAYLKYRQKCLRGVWTCRLGYITLRLLLCSLSLSIYLSLSLSLLALLAWSYRNILHLLTSYFDSVLRMQSVKSTASVHHRKSILSFDFGRSSSGANSIGE